MWLDEAGDSVVHRQPGAHAEDAHAGDETRDVGHVGVPVRMLAVRLLHGLSDAVDENELVRCVRGLQSKPSGEEFNSNQSIANVKYVSSNTALDCPLLRQG